MVAGESLERWHREPVFVAKAAAAKISGGRIFTPRELAAARMARTMLATVAQSNGQVVEGRTKEKNTTLGAEQCEALLREMMGQQDDRCALTGLPLGYDQDCADREMLVSLDRIDSSGHYTPDNMQLVCRFMNRWKGADNDGLARRLLAVLATHYSTSSGVCGA
jgi:hypothetical protein